MMKTQPFLLTALLFATTVCAADTKDPAIEQKIARAAAPVAAKMKLVRDNGFSVRSSSAVYYATERDCDGVNACTALVVYYDKAANCRPMTGWYDPARHGGNGKPSYGMKHKGVCYQIATYRKRDALAIANAIRKQF